MTFGITLVMHASDWCSYWLGDITILTTDVPTLRYCGSQKSYDNANDWCILYSQKHRSVHAPTHCRGIRQTMLISDKNQVIWWWERMASRWQDAAVAADTLPLPMPNTQTTHAPAPHHQVGAENSTTLLVVSYSSPISVWSSGIHQSHRWPWLQDRCVDCGLLNSVAPQTDISRFSVAGILSLFEC